MALDHPLQGCEAACDYFQPSFKLMEKFRDGARVIKRYSPPATPSNRVMQHDEISATVKKELGEYRARLDPVVLSRSIREAPSAMAAISSPQLQEPPHGKSIDRFLARLPNLWQQGEVRERRQIRTSAPAPRGRRAVPGTIRRQSRRRTCRAAGTPDGPPREIDGAPKEA